MITIVFRMYIEYILVFNGTLIPSLEIK